MKYVILFVGLYTFYIGSDVIVQRLPFKFGTEKNPLFIVILRAFL
jgi:hypothetical protein